MELPVRLLESETEQGLRQAMRSGALFVHLEGLVREGLLPLEDASLPLSKLGLERCWLLLLGQSDPGLLLTHRLASRGPGLILGRQLSLAPKEAAALDRGIYRGLAEGGSLVETTRRARQALLRLGGVAWAAPVLMGQRALAELSFPPDLEPSIQIPKLRQAPKLAETVELERAPGPAISASNFIQETLQQLKEPSADDTALKARKLALRRLSSGGSRAPDEAADLSPEERTARLASHLLDSISRPDLALESPIDLETRLEFLEEQTALDLRSLKRAGQALLCGRGIFLKGPPGSGRTRLAQALTSQGFGYYPQLSRAGDGTLALPPQGDLKGALLSGGALYRALAQNWRLEHFDVLEQPGPSQRMPLLAPAQGGEWQIFQGGWLLILDAERLEPIELRSLLSLLRAGVLEGLDIQGRPYRLPAPADFRLILTGEQLPKALQGRLPQIPVEPSQQRSFELKRWLSIIEQRFGPTGSPQEEKERHTRVKQVLSLMEVLRAEEKIPGELGLNLSLYAVQHGGELAEALREAVTLFLDQELKGKTEPFLRALSSDADKSGAVRVDEYSGSRRSF